MTIEEKLKLRGEILSLLNKWTYGDFGFHNEDQTRNLADKVVILLERKGLLDKAEQA